MSQSKFNLVPSRVSPEKFSFVCLPDFRWACSRGITTGWRQRGQRVGPLSIGLAPMESGQIALKNRRENRTSIELFVADVRNSAHMLSARLNSRLVFLRRRDGMLLRQSEDS